MTPLAPTKNSTSPIILIIIAVFGLIVGYFYYSQALRDQTFVIPPINVSVEDQLTQFKDFKLDFSTLDSLAFKALRIFGELPVKPGLTGRTDIFAPY